MSDKIAKPFLKWAGGKTQLINDIQKALPIEISNKPFTYIEPFVGSGAVLFWMLGKYPNLKKAVVNDINTDLINTYKTIANKPKELISLLTDLQVKYHSINGNEEEEKIYYYNKRELYNTRATDTITQKPLSVLTRIILASTKPNAWILDPFTGSSTTGIAANLSNRRYLGIDKEIDFLNISKNRKLEIENSTTAAKYKEKIRGFNNKKELELFLVNEPKEAYGNELKLY